MDNYPLTGELRRLLTVMSFDYTTGYLLTDGRRVDEDNVTTVMTEHANPLTFEETRHGLVCVDALTTEQAFFLAAIGNAERRGVAQPPDE